MFGVLNDKVTFIVSDKIETELQKQDENPIPKNIQGKNILTSSNSKVDDYARSS